MFFPNASITVFRTIRNSVWVVDEKQDISLLRPLLTATIFNISLYEPIQLSFIAIFPSVQFDLLTLQCI